GFFLLALARPPAARLEAIPGPSAVTATFSIAGITGNQFSFVGFAPQKKGRETFFRGLATREAPTIFFESTHRIIKTLGQLVEHVPQATVYLGRELTKLHEEMIVGQPQELLETLQAEPVRQKGEFVVIVDVRQ
ncbi:MAG: SAM-dependent methyltransferase, partial [Patescibacteria group bacterium]